MNAWTVVHVLPLDRHEYGVAFERSDGECATALVDVFTVHSRSAGHEPWDAEVHVVRCADWSLRTWLADNDNAFRVARECVRAS
jgi:hypothetical protein